MAHLLCNKVPEKRCYIFVTVCVDLFIGIYNFKQSKLFDVIENLLGIEL